MRFHVGDNAEDVIGGPAFKLSKIRRDARLVVLAVAELGFKEEGAPLTDVYARARQHGLELCPAEVGPQLRLQYLNQPLREFLHIAMAPIAGHGGEPTDLTVGNGGAGLILIGGDAHANRIVPSTVRFIFVDPEPPQRPETNRRSMTLTRRVTSVSNSKLEILGVSELPA